MRAIKKIGKLFQKYSGLMLVLIIMVVVVSIKNQNFIRLDNIIAVLRQMSIYGVMGVGMAIAIITGYFDLSAGAISGMCATIAAMVMRINGNTFFAILAALAVGTAIGMFNGFVVIKTKIPAFVFTLAMTQIVRGTLYLITDGSPISGMTESYAKIGNGNWLGIPIMVYIFFFVLFLGWVLLNHTVTGRSIYAVGGNPLGARYSGIKQDKIILFAFSLCGLTAGLGGVMLSAKLTSAQPTMGTGYEMDAISVAAIGGTSLAGGEGTMGGVLLGAMILGVINNGMIMMGINSYWQMVVKGIVIAAAVIIDIARKSPKTRALRKVQG